MCVQIICTTHFLLFIHVTHIRNLLFNSFHHQVVMDYRNTSNNWFIHSLIGGSGCFQFEAIVIHLYFLDEEFLFNYLVLIHWFIGLCWVLVASCGAFRCEAQILLLVGPRFSRCGAQAELLHGMWAFPGPGIEPVSPALAGRFFTTEPPGKPRNPLSFELFFLFREDVVSLLLFLRFFFSL